MGIFTDIKDNLKIAMISGNKGYFKIEELSKLNELQLKKLIDKNDNFRININNQPIYIKEHDAVYKLIKFYHTPDFNKIKELIYFIKPDTLTNILKNSDTPNIKEIIQQEYLNDFLSGKEKIDLNILEPEFIEKNKNKLLSDKLSNDLLTKFYKKELNEDDIFNNIETFSNVELFNTYNISNFIYDNDLKLLLSKITLKELKEILEDQKEVFISKYKDYQSKNTIIKILKEEHIDVVKELTNYVYDLKYSHRNLSFDQETIMKNIIAKIGKKNIYTFLKENTVPEFYNNQDGIDLFLKKLYDTFEASKINIDDLSNLTNINNIINQTKRLMILGQDQRVIFANNTNNKRYFLPDNAPEELKNKFYSRNMTYDDLINNIDYFKDTNISLGFKLRNGSSGAFENDCFLKLLKNANGIIDDIPLYHLTHNIEFDKLTYEKYIESFEIYFKNNRLSYGTLLNLKQLNIKIDSIIDNIDEIENNIKNSGLMTESFYATDIRLFSNKMINTFGYDVIKILAEYHKEKAMDLIIKYSNNNTNDFEKIKNWFVYLQNNNALNKNTVIKSITSYENCSELIGNLLKDNIKLNTLQLSSLNLILDNKNKYNVKNIGELSNYQNHKEETLNNKFNSNSIFEIKNVIYEILFDINEYEVNILFNKYQINNAEYIKYNFIDTGLIEPNLLAVITILKEIKNFKGKPDELREKYKEIIQVGNIYSKQEILSQLDKLYTVLWNKELFKPDEKKQGKASSIKGVDGSKCRQDVFGKQISSNDDIDIIELDEEPFKLIVHSFSPQYTPDQQFRKISEELYDNPSIWNNFNGSTTISTSLISDKSMGTYAEAFQNPIYYGFNHLPQDVVRNCCKGDAVTPHGGGLLDLELYQNHSLCSPDTLISSSQFDSYNEVAILRKSITEKNNFDGKIQPTCIICFDGKINDASKLAAQYFRVPIYMIQKQKYTENSYNRINNYIKGNIDKFDNQTIDDILLSPHFNNIQDFNTYELCLSLCNKALNEGLIDNKEYYKRLCYMYYVIGKIIERDYYNYKADLKRRIDEAKVIMEESRSDGIRR